jgi:hypothetical protein
MSIKRSPVNADSRTHSTEIYWHDPESSHSVTESIVSAVEDYTTWSRNDIGKLARSLPTNPVNRLLGDHGASLPSLDGKFRFRYRNLLVTVDSTGRIILGKRDVSDCS